MANEKERPTKAPVVANNTKVKKTLGKKFKEAFTHDDVESVGDYLLFSVLVPAVKDMVSDFVRNATDIFLYGSGGGRTSKGGKTNYNKVDKVSYQKSGSRDYNNCGRVDIGEVIFTTRVDAVNVLASLRSDIEDYGCATVGGFKEAAGIDVEITDHNYGWTNLDNARPAASRGGYVLVMPNPVYIK